MLSLVGQRSWGPADCNKLEGHLLSEMGGDAPVAPNFYPSVWNETGVEVVNQNVNELQQGNNRGSNGGNGSGGGIGIGIGIECGVASGNEGSGEDFCETDPGF